MATDTARIDVATASPVGLLLLADEAEEAGAPWEEVAWLRLRAAGPEGLWLAGYDRQLYACWELGRRAGSADHAGNWEYVAFHPAGRPWGVWRAGMQTWHEQPPPGVRRLVEEAAGEAVRRVLAAVGVGGGAVIVAPPGA